MVHAVSSAVTPVVRFGAFELDRRSAELRQNGLRIGLQDQPLQVLVLLLERPGELITREELRQRLWPADTFVDFEHGLNAAVKRLRDALGDSAEAPRFVETVPRRGYRFVAPVDGVQPLPSTRPVWRSRPGRRGLVAAGAAAAVTTIGLVSYIVHVGTSRQAPAPAAAPQRALTRLTFGSGVQTQPTWSPDGRFIAYSSDQSGNFDIWVQPVAGGDPVQVTRNAAHDWQPDWSPKGDWIAFRSERHGGGIFLVPALGGEERRLTTFGYLPRWSPDGTRLLFAGSGLPGLLNVLNIPTRFFVVGLDGSPPREVLRDIVAKSFNRPSVAWHPDGRLSVSLNGFAPTRWVHVALGHAHAPGPFFSTVSLDGRSRTDSAVSPAVLEGIKSAGLQNWGQDMQLAWSPAGDALYHVAWSNHVQNLWKIDVDPSTLRWIGGPHRLTAGKGPDSDPVISPDGAKAAFTAELHTRRIWSFPLDPATGRLSGPGAPVTAPELDAVNADLSRDGKTLVFEAERTGAQGHRHEVWAKSLDNGRERLLRTHDLDRPDQPNVSTPRVSPDGRLVGYSRYGPSFQSLIYDSATGEERRLTQADQPGTEWLWGWSADGQWLVAAGTKHTAPAWGIWLLPLSGAPRAERHLRTVTTSTDYSLWQAGLSPEGRWVSFEAVPRDPSTATLFAVPASGGPWVQLSEGRFWDDKPRWSSDGRFLYFVSSRDGLLDVWAMRFDSDRGRPGDPFRVTRFDDPRTMIFPAVGAMEIAVARHRLVVPVLEVAGSIWMLDNVDR